MFDVHEPVLYSFDSHSRYCGRNFLYYTTRYLNRGEHISDRYWLSSTTLAVF